MVNRTKLRKYYNILLRGAIIIITYYYIYRHVLYKESAGNILSVLYEEFSAFRCTVLIILMFMNWGVEAIKWKFLIKKIEKLSFIKAYSGVLSGVTVSTFLPNRTGEYLGRVFIFDRANRIEGILITIIGSISQLLITIVFGLISITFILKKHFGFAFTDARFTGILVFNAAVIFLCLFLYFNISSLMGFVNRFKFLRKYKLSRYLKVFSYYSYRELMKVVLLSLLRYLIFGFQFYLILHYLGVEFSIFKAAIFVSTVFFITTIVPTITIIDPGVRGTVALSVYSIYFMNMDLISGQVKLALVTSSSLIWFLNIIIPAFIGSFFVFRLKFFRKNN